MVKKEQRFTLLNKKFFEFLKTVDEENKLKFYHILKLFVDNPALKAKGFKDFDSEKHENASAYLNEIIDETTQECTSLRVSNHLPELKNLVTMNKMGVPTRRPYGNICLLFFGRYESQYFPEKSEKGNYCFTKERRFILVSSASDIKRIEDYYKSGDTIPYYAYVFVPNFTTDEDVQKLIDASLVWTNGKGNVQFVVPELSNEYTAPLAKPIYGEALFEIKPYDGKNKNKKTDESVTVVSGTSDIASIPLGSIAYINEENNILLEIEVTLKIKECPEIFTDWIISYANLLKHGRTIYDYKNARRQAKKK